MTTTDNSRADALTADRFYVDHGVIHDTLTGKHVTLSDDGDPEKGIEICCALMNELARGPLQPAAAPIAQWQTRQRAEYAGAELRWLNIDPHEVADLTTREDMEVRALTLASQPAPSPADERAAEYRHAGWWDITGGFAVIQKDDPNPGHCVPLYTKLARAASANETGAEGAKPIEWAAKIIDALQGSFDTEGITENDSGDALIRLSSAKRRAVSCHLLAATHPSNRRSSTGTAAPLLVRENRNERPRTVGTGRKGGRNCASSAR